MWADFRFDWSSGYAKKQRIKHKAIIHFFQHILYIFLRISEDEFLVTKEANDLFFTIALNF